MQVTSEELKAAIREVLAPVLTMDALSRQEVFSVEEAAQYIRHSTSALNHWRTAGTGPKFVLISRKVVYRKKDLDEYLNRHIRHTRDHPQ